MDGWMNFRWHLECFSTMNDVRIYLKLWLGHLGLRKDANYLLMMVNYYFKVFMIMFKFIYYLLLLLLLLLQKQQHDDYDYNHQVTYFVSSSSWCCLFVCLFVFMIDQWSSLYYYLNNIDLCISTYLLCIILVRWCSLG